MKKLSEGIFLFKNAISIQDRNSLLEFYNSNQEYFYVPKLRGGYSMKLSMACFGKHWNPVDYHYYESRNDFDGKTVPKFPNFLANIANPFLQQCFPQYPLDLDIAIVNQYNVGSSLGLHRDDSESQDSLASGYPVVSFSIGASARFMLGGLKRTNPVKTITLGDGDVLIFGGPDRLCYHGVSKILESDKQRINFTLRKS